MILGGARRSVAWSGPHPDDLARSGSKTGECGRSGETRMARFGAASQPIVGKPDSYALSAEAGCDSVDSGRSP